MGFFANTPHSAPFAFEVRLLMLDKSTGKTLVGSVGVQVIGCCVACVTEESIARIMSSPHGNGSGNLCPCGAYVRHLQGAEADAVLAKAAKLKGGEP